MKQFKQNKESGLASVEAVLIIPVLLLMMYIMVNSAKTLVLYQQRIVESRNAAYTTELYNGGVPSVTDRFKSTVDDQVQVIEEAYMRAAQVLAVFGKELDITDYINNSYIEKFNRIPVQRYSTIYDDAGWFYEFMLETSRDDMDSHYSKDDPAVMTRGIRNLFKVLDDDFSKSKLTTGVGVSPFASPVGKFHPAGHAFLMRNYHTADFSNTLDLLDPEINSAEAIKKGYNLKAGYSKEMKAMLKPERLFTDIFASTSTKPLATPGIVLVPPIVIPPVVVGIVDQDDLGRFGNVPANVSNSNGVDISPTVGKTTTILGRYGEDMNSIINTQLQYPKTEDLDAKTGGYNVLNVPDNKYNPDTFWEDYNTEFLDKAVARGDVIVLATPPTPEHTETGGGNLTTFGREIEYLESKGYSYNPRTGRMEKL